MNRMLITELGDAMRNELKKQKDIQKPRVVTPKNSLPEIKPNIGVSSLFIDSDLNDNPLYRKSLSEIALLNLAKIATISLFGSQSKEQLEEHIREDLQIEKKNNYLNRQLSKQVKRITNDNNLMTKKKRKLVVELKKLEEKSKTNKNVKQVTDLSQLSTIVEDVDRETKIMEIINTEGKLLQLQRRYQQKVTDDSSQKKQIQMNYSKFKEEQEQMYDSLQVLPSGKMKEDVKDIINNLDLSEERYKQRLNDRHIKLHKSTWLQHHFPQNYKN